MRTLKLTATFVTTCLLLSRLIYAQGGGSITLTENNASLEQVLKDIRDKYGYAYGGDAGWTTLTHPVSFSVHNATLEEVLRICFKDQPVIYRLDGVQHTIDISIRPVDDRDIRGRIIDEGKEPVSGVTVYVVGRGGTISNERGEFTYHVHYADSKLVLSSIAYESQTLSLPPPGEEMLVVMHSRIGALAEAVVVHTGYQDIKSAKTTASAEVIDNDLLNRRVSTNVLDRIDGIASSVLFNKNIVPGTNQSTITIRGRSTIFANPNPLIVVDNFPYPGDLSNINPADVESITILKDAAAASIWGAFSGNGVIVITTKKGRLNSKPRISFSSSVTTGWKPDLYYQKILSSGDYIDIEGRLFQRGFYDNQLANPNGSVLSPAVEIMGATRSGELSSKDSANEINYLRTIDSRSDLDKYFYRRSLNSQYALSVSGGSNEDQYYVSAGYDQNVSNLVNDLYNRITLTGNNTYEVLPGKLELSTGLGFTASTTYLSNTGATLVNYPYAQLADAQGRALPVNYVLRRPYVDTAGDAFQTAGGPGLLDWHYRPLDELRNANNKLTLTDYRINIGLRYSIWRGLEARAYYQFGHGDSDIVNYYSLQSWLARNMINQYTQIAGTTLSFPVPRAGILREVTHSYMTNNLRLQLSYNDSLFRHGRLNMIAGGEIRDLKGDDRTNWLYGYDPTLGSSMPMDYIHTYPNYVTGVATQIPYQDGMVGTSERYVSYYANTEYIYRNRYIFSASVRHDASNLFAVKENQKGVPLWSAGFGWEISKEQFYHLAGIPFLKLRVTDGYNGNVDRNVTAYTTANVNTGVNSFNAITSAIINPPNPDLRWERIHIFNTGLDFALPQNRLGGSLEYYIKSGIDLIGYSPVDPTTGVSLFQGNTANMQDHGVDLNLHADIPLGKVHWNSVLLFSYVLDKVTQYKLKQGSVVSYLSPSTINPLVGRPLYSVYALPWAGLDPTNGDPQGFYSGKIVKDYSQILGSDTLNNMHYMGPVNPPVFGSWRNNFYWKQWGFSFNLIYKFGYVFRRNSMFYYPFYSGAYSGHPDYERRWQNPGDEKFTSVPSMNYPGDPSRDDFYRYSEVLVQKGDHIRLQDIELSYDYTKSIHHRLPVGLIRLYLYANNLGILWKANKAGIDPDFVTGVPNPRTLAFGVQVEY
jgi:TonB-dependent starch-binding outer membrane protein SusC